MKEYVPASEIINKDLWDPWSCTALRSNLPTFGKRIGSTEYMTEISVLGSFGLCIDSAKCWLFLHDLGIKVPLDHKAAVLLNTSCLRHRIAELPADSFYPGCWQVLGFFNPIYLTKWVEETYYLRQKYCAEDVGEDLP